MDPPKVVDMAQDYEQKNVSESADAIQMDRAKLASVVVGGMKVARFELKSGWKWSTDVKPMVKTEWCEAPHYQYMISGKMRGKMRDGREFEVGPGDVFFVPPGHDTWVTSEEPAVGIEFRAEAITGEISKSR